MRFPYWSLRTSRKSGSSSKRRLPATIITRFLLKQRREGIKLITAHPPEVIILDLGLPDMDGLDVIRAVREWSAVPVIVLSARGQEQDKVTALELGADDYLTKPFGVPELLARLKVALRHARQSARPPSAII